ncbi:tRNA intron endonuclease [Gilbertella persicaria]|uniref:tRNA intron endonuclease n=1 Tax=Gilbertella persicaria TaxID=101096 RepID=UPI00221F73DD|nr:tRNA intron endonuclease [Gilbertella persicaria]KAI8056491.1 tRNA intron endonuclease [Gilbertella persicaria]
MSQTLPVQVYCADTLYKRFLSYILHIYYSIKTAPPIHKGTFMGFGRFVWIHDQTSITQLYHAGSFGKGSLSRSQATWFTRTLKQNSNSLEDITTERRKKRRQQHNIDHSTSSVLKLLDFTLHQDVEKFQLDLYEAFFLVYGLNALTIQDSKQTPLSIQDCWHTFCKADSSFHFKYAAYHYYRSLGWVPKNGSKFGVDFVLYQRGPSFRHADYAVVIMPVYTDKEEQKSWQWLLRLNRVSNQVKKTLVLCHVTIPTTITSHLQLNEYSIKQVTYERWSPQRNRE